MLRAQERMAVVLRLRLRLRCLQMLLFFPSSALEVRKLLLGVLSRICIALQARQPAVAR